MKKTRIASTLILSIVLMISTFTGCTTQGPTTTQPEPDQPAVVEESQTNEDQPSGDVTLSIMAAQDWIKDVEQFELAEKFKEETGISIDFQITPSDQYDSLLSTKLNSKTCPDIFMGQSGSLNIGIRYMPEQNCVDLSNEPWVGAYSPVVKNSTSYNDKLYGMTIWNVDAVWSMVYNKTIFAQYGLQVPKTYDEFKQVCETLKANGVTPVYESVADLWHPVCSYLEMFVQIEKDSPGTYESLNNNTLKLADIPEAVTLTNQVKELGQNYSGDSYLSNEFAGAAAAMASGEYAMTVNRAAFINEIVSGFADQPYGKSSDYGAFVIPYIDNNIRNINPQGPSRFIFSGSPHIEEAKQYLAFLAENMQTFVDGEPTFTSLPFDGLTPNLSAEEAEFFENYPETGEVLQSAVSYIDPQWNDIGKDVQSLYLDQMTAEELLQNIDKRRAEQAAQAGDSNWN